MDKKYQKLIGFLMLLFLVFSVGCNNQPTTTPNPSTTKSETTQSETTSGTTVVPFQLEVIPEQLKGFAIAGQRIVFLARIKQESLTSESAAIMTAQSADAEISISPASIREGQIAEITVIPKKSSIGKTVTVKFSAERDKMIANKALSFEVIEGEDDRKEYAEELRSKFVKWLAAEHPELGISLQTQWTGTMVSPQWLVVSHYLFFSDEWEMHVEWHIMIAPDDWARIDLRKRFTEFTPSRAYEISSREANKTPIEIEVPEAIWR